MAPPPDGVHLADRDGPPLTARGARVRVAPVAKEDLVPYRHAVLGSADRLARWNPVDPGDLERHLRFQSSGHRTFIVHALEPLADHDIVGRVNVTNVVRGRALAATLGYDAYDPYAGRGLFAEGLRLVVDLALAPEPRGMGLHRVEASVQPGNVRSAGLLRSLGFRRRGAWPDYLWLPDDSGAHSWRDHVTYGVTAKEWPTPPYDLGPRDRPLVVVPSGEERLGELVAAELGVPLLGAATLAALGDSLVEILRTGPGAVLVGAPAGLDRMLADAGYPPGARTDAAELDLGAPTSDGRRPDDRPDPDRLPATACLLALTASARVHAAGAENGRRSGA